MSDEDDVEGEYTNPIPSPILTTNPNLDPRSKVQLSSAVGTKLPQEIAEPEFVPNNIGYPFSCLFRHHKRLSHINNQSLNVGTSESKSLK